MDEECNVNLHSGDESGDGLKVKRAARYVLVSESFSQPSFAEVMDEECNVNLHSGDESGDGLKVKRAAKHSANRLMNVEEFKKDYYLHTKYNLKVQIPHLLKLADHYSRRFSETQHWADCIKAHALYNSAAVRESDEESKDIYLRKAFTIQQIYWKSWSTVTYEQQTEMSKQLKSKLVSIREKYDLQLKELHSVVENFDTDSKEMFTERMQNISTECSSDMIKLANDIMRESVKALINPCDFSPCDFSAIAIGSLAKGEATPFSDLEYLFLVKEKSPELLQYFEQLALTSYFLIGSLRETTLEYMDIRELSGWFKDCAQSGFKIDGLQKKAGNIPTGNGRRKTKNHFIVTPDELKSRYAEVSNSPDANQALQGDLTSMLKFTTIIYNHGESANEMHEGFRGFVETCDITKGRENMNIEMLKTDAKKFNFTPDEKLSAQGFLVDVKRELYRFPTILALDLSIVFNCMANSSWEMVEMLRSQHRISDDLFRGLKFMIAAACYIRLSAYISLDSHDDKVSVAPKSILLENASGLSTENRRWFVPVQLFIALCETSMPIKQQVSELLDINTANEVPDLTTFQTEHHLGYKFLALQSCGRYFEALTALQQVIGGSIFDPNLMASHFPGAMTEITILKAVESTLYKCSKYKASLRFSEYIYQQELSDKNTIRLARCHQSLGYNERANGILLKVAEKSAEYYDQLGGVQYDIGEYDEAECNSIQALQLYYDKASQDSSFDYYGNLVGISREEHQEIAKPDLINCSPEERLDRVRNATPDIIMSLSLLSNIYWRKNNLKLAKLYNKKIDRMIPLVYGENSLVHITAHIRNSRAINYDNGSEYSLSEETYKNALALYEEMYGRDNDHVDIAKVLSNLGVLYHNTGDYRQAEDYSKRALGMYRRVYGEKSVHPDIIRVMRNLGNTYRLQGDHTKAEEYYKTPVSLLRQHHGPQTDHRDIAYSLHGLGVFYDNIKQYNDAHDHLMEALSMYRRIYGTDNPHQDIAQLLCDIGYHYFCISDYHSAVDYSHRSLDMYKKLYGEDGCDRGMGTVLNNLGVSYNRLKKYDQAKKYLLQALDVRRKLDGETTNHTQIANTLFSLGCNMAHVSDYYKALEYFHKSLDMYREIHGEDGCDEDMDTCLYNLGVCYENTVKYEHAEQYYLSSLEMRKKIYGQNSNHINIADSLNGVAVTHRKSGNPDRAIKWFKQSLSMYRIVQPDHELIPKIISYLRGQGVNDV